MELFSNIRKAFSSEPRRKSYSDPTRPVETLMQMAAIGVVGNVQNAFAENVWTYAGVKAISNGISGVPFLLRKQGKNGTPGREVTDRLNPWIRLFDNPSPYFDKTQLWKATSIYYETDGQAFWILRNAAGQPISRRGEIPSIIEVVGTKNVKAVTSGLSRYAVGWQYTDMAQTIELQPFQMLRFFEVNPMNPNAGLSPSAVSQLSIGIDQKAHWYNDKFFKNGAQIAGYLRDTNKDSELTEAEGQNIRTNWIKQFLGINNAHTTPLLTNGLEFVPTGTNQKDMDFLNLVTFLRDEIVASFNVPKNQIGIFDGMNYANSKVADRQFYTNNLIPKMRYFASVVNNKLLYDTPYECYFDFGTIDALKDDRDQRMRSAEILFKLGYPLNEINMVLELGLEEIPKEWAKNAVDVPRTKAPAGGSSPSSPSTSPAGAPSEPDQADGKDPAAAQEHPNSDKNPNPKGLDDIFDSVARQIADKASVSKAIETPSSEATAPVGLDGAESRRAFDADVVAPVARKLRPKLVSTLTKMRNDQLARLDKMMPSTPEAVEAAIFDKNAWGDFYLSLVAGFASEAADLSVDFTLREMDTIGIALELADEDVERIEDKLSASYEIPFVVLSLWDRLAKALKAGLEAGNDLDAQKQVARDVFKVALTTTPTISYTEIAKGANVARFEVISLGGVMKSWITSADSNVRGSHAEFGTSGAKELDFEYAIGLKFPNDPASDIGEVVGCRCHIIPVRKQ